MNFKILSTFALVLSFSSITNLAQAGITSTILSPTVMSDMVLRSCDKVSAEYRTTCLNALFSGQLLISVSTFAIPLKQDIQQVEMDGYQFLAGDSMSLALEETLQRVKEIAPELNDASDEDLVAILLSIVDSF